MSRRKPWEEPVHYNEDRFDDRHSDGQQPSGHINPDPDLVINRVRNPQADLKPARKQQPAHNVDHPDSAPVARRQSWRDADGGRSNDDTPLNYGRGMHDGELDVDDRDDPHYD